MVHGDQGPVRSDRDGQRSASPVESQDYRRYKETEEHAAGSFYERAARAIGNHLLIDLEEIPLFGRRAT